MVGLAAGDQIGGPIRMAVRLAESLLDCGDFNSADILKRYLARRRERAFDAGPVSGRARAVMAAGMHAGKLVRGGRFIMNDVLRRKWHDLLRVWAVDPALADRTFEDVREHYAEPGRFYHTLDHVQTVLETVESLGSYARNLNAVKLATWLHDVIYDSKASDNEERSADYAERLCEKFSIPEGHLVTSLILRTKTHDAGDDADAQVLLDADLAILGASEPAYRAYAEKIRQEYAWVPEPDYRQGRAAGLAELLEPTKDFPSFVPSGRPCSPEHRRRDRTIGGCLRGRRTSRTSFVSHHCLSAIRGSRRSGFARRGEKIAKAIGRRSHKPVGLLVATGEF